MAFAVACAGRRHRLLVAGEAVVQDRGRPVRPASPPALALRPRLARSRSRSARRPRLPSLAAPGASARRRRDPASGRRRDAVGLRDERGGTREVADPRASRCANAERWSGSCRKRAGVADELDLPRRDRARSRRRPTTACWRPWPPSPSAGRPPAGSRASACRCTLQRRSRGGVTIGGQQGEPVEQQVEWTRGSAGRRRRAWTARQISGRTPVPRVPGDRTPRTTRSGRSRARVPGRTARAASRPSAAAAEHRCRSPRRRRRGRAADPRGRAGTRRAARPPPWPASPRAASNAPAWKLACAAASARSARRAGSTVSATARCRNAAAAATPPRACARPAERSSSAATSSSGPGVAGRRCQARRSGSVSASVASARARCTRWRSSAAAER